MRHPYKQESSLNLRVPLRAPPPKGPGTLIGLKGLGMQPRMLEMWLGQPHILRERGEIPQPACIEPNSSPRYTPLTQNKTQISSEQRSIEPWVSTGLYDATLQCEGFMGQIPPITSR